MSANEYLVVAASGTRTADFTSQDYTNEDNRGIIVTTDIMSIAAGSLVVTLQGKDRVSSKYRTIVASAAILAAGTNVLKAYPGLTASTNATVNDILPYAWRVTAVVASGTLAYTIGASLIV